MKLTRAAMRNEIRTLTAQRDQLADEVNRLQADLYQAQRSNVRLAHTTETVEAQLSALADRYPHLFGLDEVEP